MSENRIVLNEFDAMMLTKKLVSILFSRALCKLHLRQSPNLKLLQTA